MMNNQLSGEIPRELGNLAQLERFMVSDNQLTGIIPPELGRLADLELVQLSGNRFQGCIPAKLREVGRVDIDNLGLDFCHPERDALALLYRSTDGAHWSEDRNWMSDEDLGRWYGVTTDPSGNVVGLSLSSNGLNGEIPAELDWLTNLERLYLSGNLLRGCVSDELLEVQRNDLNELRLPGCVSDREALVALYDATDGPNWPEQHNWLSVEPIGQWYGVTSDATGRVAKLDFTGVQASGLVTGNLLEGELPNELGDLSNLRELNLYGNQLRGSIPVEMGELTHLVRLDLGNNVFDGEIPNELGNLGRLEELDLFGNRLSGSIPPGLGNLENLKRLSLRGNQLNGQLPRELGRLRQLATLDLSFNQLSGPIPQKIGGLINLERLWLLKKPFSAEPYRVNWVALTTS